MTSKFIRQIIAMPASSALAFAVTMFSSADARAAHKDNLPKADTPVIPSKPSNDKSLPIWYELTSQRVLGKTLQDAIPNNDSITWSSYSCRVVGATTGDPDPFDGKLVKRSRAWFTCQITNKSGGARTLFLDDIGAQTRKDPLMLQVDPTATGAITLTLEWRIRGSWVEVFKKNLGNGIKDYTLILPTYTSSDYGLGLEQTRYSLTFSGSVDLKFRCYLALRDPIDPNTPTDWKVKETDDGYPPPGSPGDLD